LRHRNLDQGPERAIPALPAPPTRFNYPLTPALLEIPESGPVPRRVKDFIDISEFTSLDDLIRYLETIRDNLPEGCEAEMKIRGDEIFGKRLTITYFREQTPEEADLEAKYSASDDDDASIEQLRKKLDEVPYREKGRKRG
jgi:hypothetical protein